MSAENKTSNSKSRKHHKHPRAPLACESCRIRKIKCNRELPCQNCIVRDIPSRCIYRGHEPVAARARSARAEGMQERLDRLESLVTTLVTQDQGSSQAKPSSEDGRNGQLSRDNNSREANGASVAGIQHGLGVLKVDIKSSVYRGATHWRDVMEELNELKSFWSQVQDDQDDALSQVSSSAETIDAPGLLCGVVKSVEMDELLATIPPKPATDKLLQRFFHADDSPVPTFHVLHQPTFIKQYEEHWANPSETKIMWLGLLFSVLSLTMLSHYLNEEEPPEYEGISQSLCELYRLRTTQCLMMGDISKCAPHTLETLVYNVMAEWARNTESETRVWMMVGVLVRVALQMGYHRDASHYSEITIFQGEMRRRVWCFVQGLDTLTSFLVGLPSMIRTLDSDTRDPRNLHDWELTENMTSLPESRPASEETPVTYMLAKRRIIKVGGEVINLIGSLSNADYDEILKLDDELAQAYKDLPENLRMDSTEKLLKEHPSLVNRRIQLEFLYNQSVCVLHKKFLAQGRTDSRFARSYTRCMDSALSLLGQQHYLYTEGKVKGSVKPRHWYRVSHTSHEFILAAMIICLDVRYRKLEEQFGRPSNLDENQQTQVWQALEFACNIWKGEKDSSAEAAKVYQVLSQVVGTYAVEESARILQHQTTQEVAQEIPDLSLTDGDPLLGVLGNDIDINWESWDSFIEGASFQDTFGPI